MWRCKCVCVDVWYVHMCVYTHMLLSTDCVPQTTYTCETLILHTGQAWNWMLYSRNVSLPVLPILLLLPLSRQLHLSVMSLGRCIADDLKKKFNISRQDTTMVCHSKPEITTKSWPLLTFITYIFGNGFNSSHHSQCEIHLIAHCGVNSGSVSHNNTKYKIWSLFEMLSFSSRRKSWF